MFLITNKIFADPREIFCIGDQIGTKVLPEMLSNVCCLYAFVKEGLCERLVCHVFTAYLGAWCWMSSEKPLGTGATTGMHSAYSVWLPFCSCTVPACHLLSPLEDCLEKLLRDA